MKKTMTALICAAQVIATAAPAPAAELHSDRSGATPQMGSFAGARLRVPLGGGRERPQASLALAPMQRSTDSGAVRFARGAELGVAKGEPVSLKLGGRPISGLVTGKPRLGDRKLGVSTLGWVAIGVGTAVVVLGGLSWILLENINDPCRDC